MSTETLTRPAAPDPGGPGGEPRMSRWRKFRLMVKVLEMRLRFILLMAATGLVFANWDTLANRWDKWWRPAPEAVVAGPATEFYCPMHPHVVQNEPGSCPICGMALAQRARGAGHAPPMAPGSLSQVVLGPARIEQAGVRTVEVAYAPLTQTMTTVGTVAYDERKLANITARVPGKTRVETLHVNVTGQGVEVGQTLAELYSPELSQAIQELINASRRANSGSIPQTDTARELVLDRQALVRSSSEKLRRWGITNAQIDQILKTGSSDFKFPILSPIRGTVVRKNVVEGQEVQEGYPMFEVADLHTVWVKAQVYEGQLGLIHLGQPVEASVEAFPGKIFPGKVEFIQPNVDPSTRTIEVRYALDNPGLRLRPGMFATVVLHTAISETPEFQLAPGGHRRGGSAARIGHMTPEEQHVCPVTEAELGTMGPPVAFEVEGKRIWTCCDACPPRLEAEPQKYLAHLRTLLPPEPVAPAGPVTAEQQKVCPVTGLPLTAMGKPRPVRVGDQTVWICCESCEEKLLAEPEKYLARLAPPPEDQVLSVPESAVVDTGTRKIVYVEAGPGVFEGREVVIGPLTGSRYPVLKGLTPGQRVVASGAFLVDAESRLQAGPEQPATSAEPQPGTGTEPDAQAPAAEPDRHTPPSPARSAVRWREGIRRG